MDISSCLLGLKWVLKDLRAQSSDFDRCFQIYTDEGMAKNRSQQPLPVDPENYFKNSIKFESSANRMGLQIADFVLS